MELRSRSSRDGRRLPRVRVPAAAAAVVRVPQRRRYTRGRLLLQLSQGSLRNWAARSQSTHITSYWVSMPFAGTKLSPRRLPMATRIREMWILSTRLASLGE